MPVPITLGPRGRKQSSVRTLRQLEDEAIYRSRLIRVTIGPNDVVSDYQWNTVPHKGTIRQLLDEGLYPHMIIATHH